MREACAMLQPWCPSPLQAFKLALPKFMDVVGALAIQANIIWGKSMKKTHEDQPLSMYMGNPKLNKALMPVGRLAWWCAHACAVP